MDYEKAYNEALETARKINNGDGVEAPADWTVCETIFPVLREDYDDMIRGAIIDHLKDNNLTEWADWLEKQGGQKPVDKTEPKFKVGDTIRLKKGDGLEWTVEEVLNNGYYTIFCADRDTCVLLDDKWELVKQKSNKNEPKFHEGEWIITNKKHIWYVDKTPETTSYLYRLIDQYGNIEVAEFEVVDEKARLWTIQDAKDGDVVVNKSDGAIGIFQSIGHYPDGGSYNDHSYCFLHCRYDDGFFYAHFEHGNTIDSDDLIPSTKEQRDILFQKMYEASYEWDADKKELKKIDNEEFNGEDYGIDSLYHAQRILEKTLGKVDGYQSDDGILEHKCAISAVKKLYEQKPTAWSEEDESRMNNICYFLEEYGNQYYGELTLKGMINWFKSLRPQNNITDEELIKARNEAYNDALDKLEYHSDTPTFNDGWSAAIWYLKKRNDTNLKEEK